MKKVLIVGGAGFAAIVLLWLAARHWIHNQTLHAIESATHAKAAAREIRIHGLAVQLHGLQLTATTPNCPWESITTDSVSTRILWNESISGRIPMEAESDKCVVTLRARKAITEAISTAAASTFRQMKASFEGTQLSPPPSTEPIESGIFLTSLVAKEIVLKEGLNLLAEGIHCSARRGMDHWQGELTTHQFLGLTGIRLGFSSEPTGTRLTEFQCRLDSGSITGSGMVFPQQNGEPMAFLQFKVDTLPLAAYPSCPLTGQLTANLSFQGNPFNWQHGNLSGDFSANNLSLPPMAIPLLGFGLQNTHAKATGSVQLREGAWELANLSLTQPDLFAVTGTIRCNQQRRLYADLKLGLACSLLGLPTSQSGQNVEEKFLWNEVQIETTPEELLQSILTRLASTANQVGSAIPSQSGSSPQSNLREKANRAAGTLLNLLGR